MRTCALKERFVPEITVPEIKTHNIHNPYSAVKVPTCLALLVTPSQDPKIKLGMELVEFYWYNVLAQLNIALERGLGPNPVAIVAGTVSNRKPQKTRHSGRGLRYRGKLL